MDDLDQLKSDSEKFKKVMKICMEHRKKFDDADFPKNKQSLLGFQVNNKKM